MEIIVRIFIAIFLFGVGFLLIRYRKVVKSWTGNFVWAERYLGSGGTYLVLILLGCFFMVWGVVYPFGGIEMLLGVESKDATFDAFSQ